MGNVASGVRSRSSRQERRHQQINESRQQIQSIVQNTNNNQLVLHGNNQLVENLTNVMSHQLNREGKPFTKNDLYAILMHFKILRSTDPDTLSIRDLRQLTCEDLRTKIRCDIYSSNETLNVLRAVSGPQSIPVASVVTTVPTQRLNVPTAPHYPTTMRQHKF